jgi:hypothetical protein
MHKGYRAPTPVIFPVNHPSGVCSPPFRDAAPPPTPSDSGFADVKDSLLALAAACTDNKWIKGVSDKYRITEHCLVHVKAS